MHVGKLHQARDKVVAIKVVLQPALAFHGLEHFRVCFSFRGGKKKKREKLLLVGWLGFAYFCSVLVLNVTNLWAAQAQQDGLALTRNYTLLGNTPVHWVV